ncbi:hemerythrin domain-containing protein [Pacificoceanicola onchidii]|uniref:hemerythrin domain-containing protein n=1 Tax=Pacificoceanicola onchidii TaxID=2562685 RepID=UPI0010A441FC|nr:hemerythrin domain-containing protein [Pacificoceanicola onchidii]
MTDSLANASKRDPHQNATDMDLLEDPLKFLEADHLRTRTICGALDRMAEAEQPSREDIFSVLSFLENELPLLIVDEDADLMRLMRGHIGEDGSLFKLLRDVAELHADIAFRSRPAIDLLQILKQKPRAMTYSEQTCLRDLSKVLRVDMAVENARLLPLAKKLLTEDEVAELRSSMFQRRLSDFRDHRV